MEKKQEKIKLSLRRKLRFAFSVKSPLRLIFTLMIMVFTLFLTGICFLLTFYDRDFAIRQTFALAKDRFYVRHLGGSAMTLDEVKEISKQIHSPFCLTSVNNPPIEFEIDKTKLYSTFQNTHFSNACMGFAYMESEYFREEDFAAGTAPEYYNDIAISVCNAKAILLSEGLPAEDYSSLIGKQISLLLSTDIMNFDEVPERERFTVCGVYRNTCVAQDGYTWEHFPDDYYVFPGCVISSDIYPWEQKILLNEERFLEHAWEEFKNAHFLKIDSDDFRNGFMNYIVNSTEYDHNLFSTPYHQRLDEIAQKFYFPAAAFAVFTFLLLFQLTSISIERKRKMIGCLRALGCRGRDVIQIFLFESLFIGLVGGAAACGMLALSVPIANNLIMKELDVGVWFLGYSPPAFVLVMLLGLGSALFAAILPCLVESRKYPVESIKSD